MLYLDFFTDLHFRAQICVGHLFEKKGYLLWGSLGNASIYCEGKEKRSVIWAASTPQVGHTASS